MSGLKEVTVKFVFDTDNLGEEWMNRDNLELLLYSEFSTKRDLFEIVEYDTRKPETGWTLMDVELPEAGKPVQTFVNGEMSSGMWNGEEWYFNDDHPEDISNPNHYTEMWSIDTDTGLWQPLPTPPEELEDKK